MSCGGAPYLTPLEVVSGAVGVPAWFVIWSNVMTLPEMLRTIDADHGPRPPATGSEIPSPTRKLGCDALSVQPVGEVAEAQVAENLITASAPPKNTCCEYPSIQLR